MTAILHILIILIFTVCSTADFSQVQSSQLLQGGNPYLFSTDIGKGVILTLSVLQDHSPAVRKWLSLFLMAN